MTVGEKERVTVRFFQALHDALGPRCHLFNGFAIRYAMLPDVPAGNVPPDLFHQPAFIIAVIPFTKILANNGLAVEARSPAGFSGPLQRADQDERELFSSQSRPQPVSLTLPVAG